MKKHDKILMKPVDVGTENNQPLLKPSKSKNIYYVSLKFVDIKSFNNPEPFKILLSPETS